MTAIVATVAEGKLIVVAHEFQRGGHLLIRQRPVPMQVIEVVGPILQEDADRLLLGLADDAGVGIATTNVRETADVAEDFAEQVWPFPSHGEGTNSTTADAADGPLGGITAEFHRGGFLDPRQQIDF